MSDQFVIDPGTVTILHWHSWQDCHDGDNCCVVSNVHMLYNVHTHM